ncbi:MAG TPA: indole-3-glycerol phosphate synthase TrpC [Bacteroidales bacterium]|jgi:indole-3-glycerol phosphate synthase|nr:indole-3-glycerol phosphate synthase TrpC [Bacteroidales bacterium]
MGILHEIVSKKKQRLRDVQASVPLRELKSKITDVEKPRDFRTAVKRSLDENIKLIAEIKKASPSKGIIREKFDHLSIAQIYDKKHVHAVSVLTEEDFFMGSLSFLPEVKKITSKPVLRKDFIVDEYQIYETRVNSADAILLIAAILEKNQAAEYLNLARELGLSVLFEVHDFKELEMALLIACDIIGINNRNLKTLQVDMNTTFTLRREIPSERIVVSESGIKSRTDLQKLQNIGVDALLIGTSFMEAEDIGKKIDELTGSM